MYGGGSSINWAASRMTFDPLGSLCDAWGTDAEDEQDWDGAAAGAVTGFEDLLDPWTLGTIEHDDDLEPSCDD